PGAVVLKAAVDAVGRARVGSDTIELADWQVADGPPGAAAVTRVVEAAVVSEQHVARVGGVDPHGVVVGVDGAPGGAGEGAAPVTRAAQRDAQHPEVVGVIGVDADLAEVEWARAEVVHLAPRLAAVVTAVDAADVSMPHGLTGARRELAGQARAVGP